MRASWHRFWRKKKSGSRIFEFQIKKSLLLLWSDFSKSDFSDAHEEGLLVTDFLLGFFQNRNLSFRDRPLLSLSTASKSDFFESDFSDAHDKGLFGGCGAGFLTEGFFDEAAEAAGGSRAEAGKFDLSARGRLLSKGVGALGGNFPARPNTVIYCYKSHSENSYSRS